MRGAPLLIKHTTKFPPGLVTLSFPWLSVLQSSTWGSRELTGQYVLGFYTVREIPISAHIFFDLLVQFNTICKSSICYIKDIQITRLLHQKWFVLYSQHLFLKKKTHFLGRNSYKRISTFIFKNQYKSRNNRN